MASEASVASIASGVSLRHEAQVEVEVKDEVRRSRLNNCEMGETRETNAKSSV